MPKHVAPDIAALLRARILSGELASGSLLANERELAEAHGVARNTIRNAFAILEHEGLIARHVGRGTFVKERASDELMRLISQISGAAPIDILNLRLIIEPQVAAMAAVAASALELAAIADADAQMRGCAKHDDFELWDNEFHGRIYAASRNAFLINLHRILSVVRWRPTMMEIRRRSFTPATRQAYCAQHDEILRAIRQRNAVAAAQAMKAHLATRKHNYFGE